jgi:hypothetical protein
MPCLDRKGLNLYAGYDRRDRKLSQCDVYGCGVLVVGWFGGNVEVVGSEYVLTCVHDDCMMVRFLIDRHPRTTPRPAKLS